MAGVGAGGAAAEISGLEYKGDKWYEHYHAVRRVRESEVGMPSLVYSVLLFGVLVSFSVVFLMVVYCFLLNKGNWRVKTARHPLGSRASVCG